MSRSAHECRCHATQRRTVATPYHCDSRNAARPFTGDDSPTTDGSAAITTAVIPIAVVAHCTTIGAAIPLPLLAYNRYRRRPCRCWRRRPHPGGGYPSTGYDGTAALPSFCYTCGSVGGGEPRRYGSGVVS